MSSNIDLHELATRLEESSISKQESDALRNALASDREACEMFVEQYMLFANLQEYFGLQSHVDSNNGSTNTTVVGRQQWMRLAALVSFVSVVACLIVMIFAPQTLNLFRSQTFAVFSYSEDAKWRGEAPMLQREVGPGQVELLSGMARFDFTNGSTVSLKGPALFEFVTNDCVKLNNGKIVAFVPESAIGFRVETPELNVTDLGTAFGVLASPLTGTEVCVFEGKVRVEDSVHMPQLLVAGDSIAKSGADLSLESTVYSTSEYDALWSMTSGIFDASGSIRIVSPGPGFSASSHRSDKNITVFTERLDIKAEEVISGKLSKLLARENPHWDEKAMASSHRLRSYLVQFAPENLHRNKIPANGRITFDGAIVGIISNKAHLDRTDSAFGHANTDYSRFKRGAEFIRSGQDTKRLRDQFMLLDDGHSLDITFYSRGGSNIDQVRVLVQVP